MSKDEAEERGATALLSALVTEHFALQGIRGNGGSEATSRASLYLATLSSALIALGFVAGDRHGLFTAFAVAVLPVVALLGVITFARLVDLGIQDIARMQDIQHIREYYRSLSPRGPEFFAEVDWRDVEATIRSMGLRAGPLQLLTTSAAMVAIVNSAVCGTAVGAALAASTGLTAVGVGIGIVVAIALAGLQIRWQWRVNARAFDRVDRGRLGHGGTSATPRF